jgi:hypothetical protein
MQIYNLTSKGNLPLKALWDAELSEAGGLVMRRLLWATAMVVAIFIGGAKSAAAQESADSGLGSPVGERSYTNDDLFMCWVQTAYDEGKTGFFHVLGNDVRNDAVRICQWYNNSRIEALCAVYRNTSVFPAAYGTYVAEWRDGVPVAVGIQGAWLSWICVDGHGYNPTTIPPPPTPEPPPPPPPGTDEPPL